MKALIFLLLIPNLFCSANDSTWLNKKWQSCNRDTATYYSIISAKDSGWQQQTYLADNKQLFMQGYFDDPGCMNKNGPFTWYSTHHRLTDSMFYAKNIPRYICHFHENGMKKRLLINNENNITTVVRSWDATGIEIYADTFYNNRFGRDCNKDTAVNKQTVNLEDSLWHYRFFNSAGDTLISEFFYTERLGGKMANYFRYFKKGVLRDSASYNEHGKIKAITFYYNSGSKNAWHSFDSTGRRISVKNWDQNGNEIKPDTAISYARPQEGFRSWQRNILKEINNNKAIDKKRRQDLYGSVLIGFFVEEDGSIVETFICNHSPFEDMDNLVLKACRNASQNWQPCIFHGRRERFYGVHSFSFIKGKVIRYQTLY